MIFPPALDLAINLADEDHAGLLSVNGSRVCQRSGSRRLRLPRNCDGPVRVRGFLPCQSGEREFDEVNLAPAIVRVAIGIPDKAPSTGIFPLAVGVPLTSGVLVADKLYLILSYVAGDNFANIGASVSPTAGQVFTATGTTPTTWTHGSALWELTADLSVAATAAQVETALNATAAIAALGGVTVTKSDSLASSFWVRYNLTGPQTALAGPLTAGMTPKSIVSVSRVEPGVSAGVGSVNEVQLIRLLATPYCFATVATQVPASAAVITELQPATQDLPARYRLTLDPMAYDGHAIVDIDGAKFELPHNALRAYVQSMVGPAFWIEKFSEKAWDFAGKEPAQDFVLTATVDGLVVPGGVTGDLETSTPGMLQTFAESTADWIKFFIAVDIQFPGRKPFKAYQGEIEIPRDLIDLGSVVPPTMMSLQFVASNVAGNPWTYTNTITALRGGPAALEAVDTTLLAVDTRYEFFVAGRLKIAVIESGSADPADPNGQVAPLNYNATLNNKHWRIEGL